MVLSGQKTRRPSPPASAFAGAAAFAGLLLVFVVAAPVSAQTTATLSGHVRDPQGAAIVGARVQVLQPASGVSREVATDGVGHFSLTNIPLDTYLVTVLASGFEPLTRDVALRSSIPVSQAFDLAIASQLTVIDVVASAQAATVDARGTGTRTTMDLAVIEGRPLPIGSSRGIEGVLASFPGFAQNANGAIHPRGAHNQMTYVVDGLAISDQLTGAFANALDLGMVQTVELMTGNIPVEFGSKVSGVAIVNTRSGMGLARALSGEASIGLASDDARQAAISGGGQRGALGYYAFANAFTTDRFLDAVSLDNLHNEGRAVRGFARLDWQARPSDTLRVNVMGGRSRFELANLRSQEARGQDQRQRLGDVSAWGSHLRTIGSSTTVETIAAYRATSAQLVPSAADTPVTASQDRTLAAATVSSRVTHARARHTWRGGVDLQFTPVRESFRLGITDASFNDPLSPGFNPNLVVHDLTRGGRAFTFNDERTGRQLSAFVHDEVRWSRVTLSAGLRFDAYQLIVREHAWQPRVGVSWSLVDGRTVVRASYNRLLQTPPNENLLLSSSRDAARLAPPSVQAALGGAYVPMRAERQHAFEVGWQQALPAGLRLDVSGYVKRARDQQDNNNFFDTGIIFPVTLQAIRVRGLDARLSSRPRAGVSGSVSLTHAHAVSSPPFTGGLFLGQDAIDLLGAGDFVIDHDQKLGVHADARYAHPRGGWVAVTIRHDSGLVANPSDPAEVAADSDFADLLPYVDLASTPARVRPRTIVDLGLGYERRVGGRVRWGVRGQVSNLFDRVALFNFQSVFVGTRLVAPRTIGVRATVGW